MSKPGTVGEYIDQAPEETREKLREMRACLREVAPDAEESLKWGTPAFSLDRILFTYGGFKHHIGFYPTPAAIEEFAEELEEYETGKGSIQFPLDKPLPVDLIHAIAAFRVNDLEENDAKWM